MSAGGRRKRIVGFERDLKLFFTIIDIAQDSRFPWLWIYGSVAVVMLTAMGVFIWVSVQSRREAGEGRTANAPPSRVWKIPAERLDQLSRFDPPRYEPGAGGSPQFERAMQRYSKQDYAGAIPGLRALTEAQPDSVEPGFYLAICELITNDRPSAVEELKSIVAAGNTAYLERARFYLAKGLLGSGDARAADVQLRIIVEMHGSFEKQAQVLLAQITPAS